MTSRGKLGGAIIALREEIITCRRCPRLRDHCAEVARIRRRAFIHETYWGKPVPSFGDPKARFVLVGLAPGAHGANRTGRLFTGDSSGDWLYRALHEAGFANQPTSTAREDGLELRDALVTCAARCAPPQNRPLPGELAACRPFLERELCAVSGCRVILALGRIAFDAALDAGATAGLLHFEKKPKFAHDAVATSPHTGVVLLSSYHPSRQNTQTGRLTRAMFAQPFARARQILAGSEAPTS